MSKIVVKVADDRRGTVRFDTSLSMIVTKNNDDGMTVTLNGTADTAELVKSVVSFLRGIEQIDPNAAVIGMDMFLKSKKNIQIVH